MKSATSSRFKKKALSLLFAAVTTLLPSSASSHEPGTEQNPLTHPQLTSRSVEFYQQSDDYNQDPAGHEIKNNPHRLKDIIHGTIFEDSPQAHFIRAYNHFTDFENANGILGFPSSREWLHDKDAQLGDVPTNNFLNQSWSIPLKGFYDSVLEEYQGAYPEGDHTWEHAVSQQSFESLGHILHLIQDASVPAHVRNDAHAGFPEWVRLFSTTDLHDDSYEIWAKNNLPLLSELHPAQMPQYQSITDILNAMIEFTGKNFFSDDSVGSFFGNNSYTSPDPDTLTQRRDGLRVYYYRQIEGEEIPIARRGYLRQLVLDDTVLREQWKVLGTKAVELGASAIQLYFKATESADPCIDHATIQCHDGDMYWIDSCGNVQDVAQYCTDNEDCDNEGCVGINPACDTHAYQECNQGQVYWKNSCGELEEIAERCTANQDCENARCVAPQPPQCQSHADRICSNSDVYWQDSCGNLEGIAQDCLENESCTDNSCVRRSCINNQETYVEGNLCWQKVPTNQQMTSRQAIQHCENLAYANFSDWRVPTIRELRTLVRGCPDIEIGGACPVYSGPDVDWNGDCTNGCPEASGPGDNGCYMTISVQGPCGGTWSSSQGGGGPFEVGVWALNYQRSE